jgi:hypothetical protein
MFACRWRRTAIKAVLSSALWEAERLKPMQIKHMIRSADKDTKVGLGGRLEPPNQGRPDDRFRRVSPVAPRPREGLLTEPTAGAQPWPRERVFMPHSRPCQREEATARSGESGLPDLLGPEIPVL